MKLTAEQKERADLARIACDSEDYEEAIRLSIKNLNERFDEPNALFFAGLAFLKTNKIGMAQMCYRRLAEIDPNAYQVWNHLGMCYQEGHDDEIGYECFQKSLQRNPRNFAALNNMALMHVNRNEPDAALNLVTKAMALTGYTEAERLEGLENVAFSMLQKHEWKKGWELYDETMGRNESRKERLYGESGGRWDGAKDKTVVIYGEQGLGDEISFAGAIPDAIRDCRKVVVDCDERMWNVFARSFPKADVYGTRYKNDNKWPSAYQFDARCSFSGLQKLYRNRTEDFPGKPYLIADPERRLQWRALFDTLPGLKVGIAWNGGITVTGRIRRSLALEDMLPILSQPCTFVSLEYKDRSKEIERFREKEGIDIKNYRRALLSNDYDDTIALVAELDLVISVTTAVIHACGAIGKECWVMTPPRPRWFYMSDTNRLPWYDSIELFKHTGRWPIPMVADKLRRRCAQASHRNQLH